MISILMALRNGVEFLPEAVASVKAQTYRDWSLHIGVNGFSWGSDVALTARKHRSRQIVVDELLNCNNKPQTLNVLAGVTATVDLLQVESTARSLIAILDVDDLWEPNKLKKQLAVIEQGYDVVGTAAHYFGLRNHPIEVNSGEITFDMLLERNHIVNSSALMRRECAVWEDTDGLDDYPLWLKLAREGKKLYNLPDMLTKIRVHHNQHFAGERDNSDEIRERWQQVRAG